MGAMQRKMRRSWGENGRVHAEAKPGEITQRVPVPAVPARSSPPSDRGPDGPGAFTWVVITWALALGALAVYRACS